MNSNTDVIYIHYGNSKFNKNKFVSVKNTIDFSKPEQGGLWASRINASWGFKKWYYEEVSRFKLKDYFNTFFKFKLNENSNVAYLHIHEDLFKLPKNEKAIIRSSYVIDFEKCLQKGIDAIELCWYGSEYEDNDKDYSINTSLYNLLYGWDCDSILILNPDIIIQIEE